MKIKDVQVINLAAEFEEPYYIANVKFKDMYATLVKITTDDGITGIGECIVRLSPRATRAIVEDILKPVVIGRDPLDVEGIWNDMYKTMRGRGHSRGFFVEAISGVDMALWDILGKYHGLPISKLLGGYGREKVVAYASSLMHKDIEVLEKEAEGLVATGYKGIKLKVGRGIDRDVENVRRIRNVIGDDINLMIDANSYYDASSAVVLGKKIEEYDVYWFEEPVPTDDLRGYERLNRTLTIPIAGGESEFAAFGFRDLLERDALDIVQPDIARAGGFTECRRIAALAAVYNKPYAPHTGMSSAVCMAASMQLAAALPNFLSYEYMYIDTPLQHILSEPIPPVVDGYVQVSKKPGLGFELDEKKIKKYIID